MNAPSGSPPKTWTARRDRGSDAVLPVPCANSSLTELTYFDQAKRDEKRSNPARQGEVTVVPVPGARQARGAPHCRLVFWPAIRFHSAVLLHPARTPRACAFPV